LNAVEIAGDLLPVRRFGQFENELQFTGNQVLACTLVPAHASTIEGHVVAVATKKPAEAGWWWVIWS
jgi:hypothetical protein